VTSGGVNQQAQSAEQQNQQKAQQYAAAQQTQALAALQAYLKANPSPNSQAAPLQAPGASSPATIGGGTAPGSAGAKPPMQPGAQPAQPPGGGTNPQLPGTLSPQVRQALIARLSGQTGGSPAMANVQQPKAM
jgi:hypothetical protein